MSFSGIDPQGAKRMFAQLKSSAQPGNQHLGYAENVQQLSRASNLIVVKWTSARTEGITSDESTARTADPGFLRGSFGSRPFLSSSGGTCFARLAGVCADLQPQNLPGPPLRMLVSLRHAKLHRRRLRCGVCTGHHLQSHAPRRTPVEQGRSRTGRQVRDPRGQVHVRILPLALEGVRL